MSKCTTLKENNEQCQANAMTGTEPARCFIHNPAMEVERKVAISQGGKGYGKELVTAEPIDWKTLGKEAISYLLQDTINRVRKCRPDGSLDLRTANSIGFLSSKLLESYREIAISDRLEALEKRLGEAVK